MEKAPERSLESQLAESMSSLRLLPSSNTTLIDKEQTSDYLTLYQVNRMPKMISLTFQGHNLGYFATTESSTLNDTDQDVSQKGHDHDVQPSILMNMEKIESFNGINLSVGFETSTKVQNYQEFHTLKNLCFQRWLVDHRSTVFENINGNDALTNKSHKPDFVCNVGRISNILITPLDQGNAWQFYAVRYNDIIFLYNAIPEMRGPSTIQSHCGVVYKRLVTGDNPEVDGVNEFDKVWAVTQSTFGRHKFILLTGGQVDKDGKKVNTRVYNPDMNAKWRLKYKFLSYWAITAVAGAKKLLLGTRNHRHILQKSDMLTLDQLWMKSGESRECQQKCFEFCKHVINWIQGHFVKNDPFHVRHYKWAGMNERSYEWADESTPFAVECKVITEEDKCREISSQILPDFFVDVAFKD